MTQILRILLTLCLLTAVSPVQALEESAEEILDTCLSERSGQPEK